MNGLCGLRLNTTGMVIGWVGAAFSLLSIVLISVGLSRVDELAKAVVDNLDDPNVTEESIRRGIIVIASIYLTINLINLISSALLIVGTVKERHLLLVPWLFNSGVSLIFGAIYLIYLVVFAISNSTPFGSIAFSLISGGAGLAIQYIVWSVIYSLFKNLQASREQQQQLISTAGSSYPSYTKI